MILWHVGTTLAIIWFVMRGNPRVDYRLVALGAILPDLIDKPIGRLLFRARFDSGRLFFHTLLVNVALFSILFFMRGRLKRKAVLVPIGSLLHLLEDGVFSEPKLFWWPLFGTTFPPDPVGDSLFAFLVDPLRHGSVLLQEAVGALLIVWLLAAHEMLTPSRLRAFLRTGQLVAYDDPRPPQEEVP